MRTHVYSYDNTMSLRAQRGNRTRVIKPALSEAERDSGTCSYTSNNLNQYTAAGATSFTYDDSGNMTADGHYGYTYDPENRLTQVQKPDAPAPDLLAQAVDSELAFTTGGLGLWQRQTGSPSYYDGDCAQSGGTNDDDESWMQTTVQGAGTLTFWWKVSSESGCDFLEFYLDSQLQSGRISGEVDWQQKSYTITGSGTHTLRWRYVKDGSSPIGDDCGWVDYVQWSVPLPEPAADAWGTLNYLYDASGRRIEKRLDGRTITKYVYDGDHCLAEYDASGNLRRKYIYGPCTDEPVCMIEATQTYAGTYYYHFDALGSCVALTNSSGNTVEVYEYDVYGRVGASDPNHPNRFLFTGREYDRETGLYYYRARYYNPQIGRFLQTDPIGYGAGMNAYAYCTNNPVCGTDPSGLDPNWTMGGIPEGQPNAGVYIRFTVNADGGKTLTYDANGLDDGLSWLAGLNNIFTNDWMEKQAGWTLSGKNESTFWYLQAVNNLSNGAFDYTAMEKAGVTISGQCADGSAVQTVYDLDFAPTIRRHWYGTSYRSGTIHWAPHVSWGGATPPLWYSGIDGGDTVGTLSHELQHAKDWLGGMSVEDFANPDVREPRAIARENLAKKALYNLTPKRYPNPWEAYMRPIDYNQR